MALRFTPTKSTSEIYAFAEHADAAYLPKARIKSRYPRTAGISSPDHTLVQYFLERDDAARTQFIAVRGTDNDTNRVEDFNISERKDRQLDIPVHRGYDRVTRGSYADAKPFLSSGYKTYVTSHSLGGAVAALVSLYLIDDGVTVDRIVTFGQPDHYMRHYLIRIADKIKEATEVAYDQREKFLSVSASEITKVVRRSRAPPQAGRS